MTGHSVESTRFILDIDFCLHSTKNFSIPTDSLLLLFLNLCKELRDFCGFSKVPDAKQMYINRHFCYADKFAILTNGLGIVRHISFVDDADFKAAHPDLVVEKKTDSPDEDKSVDAASSLVPVLQDFFSLHPQFSS